ncbi:FAD-dependent oxidoreductase [Kitasatospora sp. NPDC048239]|uniref:FAD-dependent oxidoreductase n=1 Tax=Kitasatospora sp. NPDC048239 TaxID=3364046 RepID=UPI00371A403D
MADRPPTVLVAGAGPVGLTAAHELARRGVRVRLIDAADGPATSSRALAVHARTMEVLDQMGALDALLPLGRRVTHFTMHRRGRTLVRFDTNYETLPTRYPFSLMVDQVVTERVLRERTARHGVDIEWGVELTAVQPGPDAVEVTLRHPDGRTEETTVPWLVGADGGRSTVRRQLGMRLVGDSTQEWLNADVTLDADLAPDSNHLLHTDPGTLLLVPFPEPGKWRVVDTVDVAGADDPELVRRRLAAKVGRALGRPVEVGVPSWLSVFTVQQRQITRMRSGRCFLAGDAAHVHSPASGQGMNSGLQDAYNLAWKLADVVRGHAGPELLDSYDAERVPTGAVLLRSTRTATALVSLRTALAPALLTAGTAVLRAVPPLRRRIEGRMIRGFCGLALAYPDSPLTLPTGAAGAAGGTGGTRGAGGIRPGDRVPGAAGPAGGGVDWGALRAELADPRWTLLACVPGGGDSGAGVPAAGIDGYREVLAEVERSFGAAVSVRLLADGDGPGVVPDADGTLRRSLGVAPGEFLLIRPDGYLAARDRGPDRIPEVLRACALLPEGVAPAPH